MGWGTVHSEDTGMSKVNEPAFPLVAVHGQGVTIRQYYATRAMQAWVGTYSTTSISATEMIEVTESIASVAFAIADAMIVFEENEGVKP